MQEFKSLSEACRGCSAWHCRAGISVRCTANCGRVILEFGLHHVVFLKRGGPGSPQDGSVQQATLRLLHFQRAGLQSNRRSGCGQRCRQSCGVHVIELSRARVADRVVVVFAIADRVVACARLQTELLRAHDCGQSCCVRAISV